MSPKDPVLLFTRGLGRIIFTARWLMAPIYVGLLVSLLLLLAKFLQKLALLLPALWDMSVEKTVLSVLSLVDLTLVANLLLIVVLAGWQSFVSPLLGSGEDGQPGWLALDFSAVKLKLIGSIATIAAVEMLETYMHVEPGNAAVVAWKLAILLCFGLLGLLLAAMDRLNHHPKE